LVEHLEPVHLVPSKTLGDAGLLLQNAAEWFGKDVANGDVCTDTIKTYIYKLRLFLDWCAETGLHPFEATPDDIKTYRKLLVNGGILPSGAKIAKQSRATIQSKLSIIRAFYDSAVSRGFIGANPAHKILPPRNRSAAIPVRHFSTSEIDHLKEALPKGSTVRDLRDLAIFMLCMVEGVRRISISRANVEDVSYTDKGSKILVHGKGKDYYIYPSAETTDVLVRYLNASGLMTKSEQSKRDDRYETPLFMSFHKEDKNGNQEIRSERVTRNGVNDLVNRYLLKAGIKSSGRSVHALRHTCGFQVFQLTKDVKMVQQVLGHATMATAAIYSHTEDADSARITSKIEAFRNMR
jgi:integrase/recombinase XerC/integrase/recombinase XerD